MQFRAKWALLTFVAEIAEQNIVSSGNDVAFDSARARARAREFIVNDENDFQSQRS